MERLRGVPCSCCTLPVTDIGRQLEPNKNRNSTFHSYVCEKTYCMRPSCPMSMRNCWLCFRSSCEDCDCLVQTVQCPWKMQLKSCHAHVSCDECYQISCKESDKSYLCEGCDIKVVCTDCLRRVDGCSCVLCGECYQLGGVCSKCDARVCSNCNGAVTCSHCYKRICSGPSCR
jgi:hypothetical protein